MAHVKVVRRSMRPEEWTDLRFVWLQRGIYEEKFEITDLEIRDARQISEDQYEYYSDEYRPLKKDDMYFTPDGTVLYPRPCADSSTYEGEKTSTLHFIQQLR